MINFIFELPELSLAVASCIAVAFISKDKLSWLLFLSLVVFILCLDIPVYDVPRETLRASMFFNMVVATSFLVLYMMLYSMGSSIKFFYFCSGMLGCVVVDLLLSWLMYISAIDGALRYFIGYYIYVVYYFVCAILGYIGRFDVRDHVHSRGGLLHWFSRSDDGKGVWKA